MMEYYGTAWKVMECSGTFSCKIVYIDLNHTPKGSIIQIIYLLFFV
jgi:hypothetical protein